MIVINGNYKFYPMLPKVLDFATRPAMMGLYIDAGNKVAVATAGYYVVTVPIWVEEGSNIANKIIPAHIVKEMDKQKGERKEIVYVDKNWFCNNVHIGYGDFVDEVFPPYKETIERYKGESLVSIGMNTPQLGILQKCLGWDYSLVTICTDLDKAMLVTGNGKGEEIYVTRHRVDEEGTFVRPSLEHVVKGMVFSFIEQEYDSEHRSFLGSDDLASFLLDSIVRVKDRYKDWAVGELQDYYRFINEQIGVKEELKKYLEIMDEFEKQSIEKGSQNE